MKLTKKLFIHNQLTFDNDEKETLTRAYQIIESICAENTQTSGAADQYIMAICGSILSGLSELLDNYTNEYPYE